MNLINKKNKRHIGGFTAIEIISVIVILGILSAVALTRVIPKQSISAHMQLDIMKMHLRYAQLRALSDDKTWGISFNGNSYTLLRDGNTAPYNLPDQDTATYTLPDGITVTGSNVTFDQWGSPGATDRGVSLSTGQTITITKNTGFIP